MALDMNDFQALMERLQRGGEEPARELVEKYGEYLRRAVRRHLDRRLRSKFDSRDFVQDVWYSFFAGLPRDRAFKDPDELVRFLVALARNKVIDETRKRLCGGAARVQREQVLSDAPHELPDGLKAPQATPSTIVMSREEWERLLQRQPLVYRRILILLREGKSSAQIARELNINARLVRRVAEKLLPGGVP
jgi:RNA polymerase sigma factor (sigma-70 family)